MTQNSNEKGQILIFSKATKKSSNILFCVMLLMKITTSVIIKNAVLLLNFLPNFFAVRLSLRSQYKVQSSGVNEAVKEIIKIICREKKVYDTVFENYPKSIIFRNSAVCLHLSAFFVWVKKCYQIFFRNSPKNCKIH